MPNVPMVELNKAGLRNAIKARGLTPTRVAAKAGCCAETVRLALRGRRVGRLVAGAIARAVGVPLAAMVVVGEQGAGTRSDVATTQTIESERGERLTASA